MNTAPPPPVPAWTPVAGYTDIRYEKSDDGIAKITINRPEVRNAFRPADRVRDAGAPSATRATTRRRRRHPHRRGPRGLLLRRRPARARQRRLRRRRRRAAPQRARPAAPDPHAAQAGGRDGRRLRHRRRPRAAHGLRPDHRRRQRALRPDRARASAASTAATAPRYMARIVGQKKAREIWFLCRQYDAQQALDMGLVNARRAAASSSRPRPCSGAARCWPTARWRCAA